MADFSEILKGHLANGTRPPGGLTRRWGNGEFADKCQVHEGSVRNWRKRTSLPTSSTMDLIECILFGKERANDTPDYADWRQELRAAYEADKKARREQKDGANGTEEAAHGDAEGTANAGAPAENFSKHREKRIFYVPVRVPTPFTGREDALEKISAALQQNDDRVATVVLRGMHGVGKTKLAAAFADRRQSQYRLTWWVSAETALAIDRSFRSLGVRLRYAATDDAVVVERVLEYLSQENADVLIIYDNVPNSNFIRPFLPRGGRCHVIITSNSHAWRGVGLPIDIHPWSPQRGAEYLVARTGRERDQWSAERLSEQLGGLPLALEQAAAFCEPRKESFAAYSARFEAEPVKLLNDLRHMSVEYGKTVTKAFQIGIKEAMKCHPAAGQLIFYMARMPLGPIPYSLFKFGYSAFGEPLASILADDGHIEIISVLRSFALIEDVNLPNDPLKLQGDRDAIALHPLMQIIVGNSEILGIPIERPEDKIVSALATALEKSPPSEIPFLYKSKTAEELEILILGILIDRQFRSKISDASQQKLMQWGNEYIEFTQFVRGQIKMAFFAS